MNTRTIKYRTDIRAHPETGEPIPFDQWALRRIRLLRNLYFAMQQENRRAQAFAKAGDTQTAAMIDADVGLARVLLQRTKRREWLSLMCWPGRDFTPKVIE